jgi:penicillin-binding protein 1A
MRNKSTGKRDLSKTRKQKKIYRKRVKGRPSSSAVNETLYQTISVVFKQFIKVAVALILIAGLAFGGIGAGMMVGYVTTAQPLNLGQLRSKSETSFIYDANGNEIARLTGSQNIDREFITYDHFSNTFLEKAFIAIEDERFETHIGIDLRRIASSLVNFFTTAGNPTQGGSTITQQTIKMISGADKRSAQRKIQEWYNAIRLERQLSKWEIMELYVNLVPMSNSFIGIQSAAKGYFGKNASELNLAESAFLVGIPNLPGRYNPLTESGRRNAFRRQRIVLSKMLELGSITDEEYKTALETEIRFVKKSTTDNSIPVHSYFVDYAIDTVKRDLMTERGYSSSLALTTIYNYGLKIHTTMDPSVQSAIDAAFQNEKLFYTNKALIEDFPEPPQAGMVIIDPSSARIIGMAGGYGRKEANFILNRATYIQRQPGSSIKPIAVYGPALDMGFITAATIYKDQILYLNRETPNDPYPLNSYRTYYDEMTIRNAIKISSNTIAAQVWMDLGGLNSLEYLKSVGINRPTENYVSISLGGLNQGVSPLEMASAYQPFANNGQYSKPTCYTRVTDTDGNIILEALPKFFQVYKPETAAIMNSILQEPLLPSSTSLPYGGTAVGYQIKNSKGEIITTAGKTGTADGNRDKWFVGYTPYYIGAVWYGYDGRLKTINIPSQDSMSGVKIWHTIMTRIHANLTPADFYEPPTLEKLEICVLSGKLATQECKNAGKYVITEFFMQGDENNPTEDCPIHQPKIPITAIPTQIPSSASESIETSSDPILSEEISTQNSSTEISEING